jgi:hypothetical protein
MPGLAAFKFPAPAGKFIFLFYEEPFISFLTLPEPEQNEIPPKFFPFEGENDLILFLFQETIGPAVPDSYHPRSVFSFWNDSFEIGVFDGMILYEYGQPLIGRIHGWTPGNRPGTQSPFYLQPKIIMEVGGIMLVHNKAGAHGYF